MRVRLALAAILALAAVLRFTALGWGLRHTPHWDERVFVEAAGWMVAAGDLDHRFYEYPGLFIYLIAPLMAFFGAPPLGPAAYLAARAVIAVFGVASVALVFVLGRRLRGDGVGLAAALLLAVSPVEVVTAHMVRPDVALGTCALAALIAFGRLGPRPGPDLAAAAALGVATAIKFTGALLAPSYVVARLFAPGPRLRRIVTVGLLAVTVVVLFTPYALVKPAEYFAGFGTQWRAHYAGKPGPPPYLDHVRFYLGSGWRSLGAMGVAALLVGAAAAWRDGRRWAPLAVYPAVVVLVMSTADLRFDRHMAPTLGVLALFAARGLEALARGRPARFAALALAAAALPAASSARYVRDLSRPNTRDAALDWVESHVTPGARILTSLRELGLDPERYEVLAVDRLEPALRLQALHMDLVIAGSLDDAPEATSGLRRAFMAESESPYGGPRIELLQVPEDLRPRYRRVPPDAMSLTASHPDGLARLADGDLETDWATPPRAGGGAWIEVRLREALPVGRIELRLGRRERRYGRAIHVLASADGASWERVPALPGRAAIERQVEGDRGRSQVLLLEPRPVLALRLEQKVEQARPWGIAELEVFAHEE